MTRSSPSVVRLLASATVSLAAWLAGRLADVARWAVNLLRDLPVRAGRLAMTLWAGLAGPFRYPAWILERLAEPNPPTATRLVKATLLRVLAWLLRLLSRLADLVGLPELVEWVLRAIARDTPLTPAEIAAAASVLGPDALRWEEIRVAEGGLLRLIFARNEGRAFTVFHTIAIPSTGYSSRANLPILVHELVHVYQHERAGSVYMGEAIYAQQTVGYDYGDADGLRRVRDVGKCYRDFNREQQAQIVQDYFCRCQSDEDVAAYEPFIAEMCEGRI
jgi:hypothetical protein